MNTYALKDGKLVPLTEHEKNSQKEMQVAWDDDAYNREMMYLRNQRNQYLSDSDWRDLPSYAGSDQTEWRSYRQSLRDLPATASSTLDESGQISGITWPEKPE